MYGPDLLRQYGYREPPETWDELERMAVRIQAGERAKGQKDFWGYATFYFTLPATVAAHA
jgi:trehalose/maltose transport system substrate-binding protein